MPEEKVQKFWINYFKASIENIPKISYTSLYLEKRFERFNSLVYLNQALSKIEKLIKPYKRRKVKEIIFSYFDPNFIPKSKILIKSLKAYNFKCYNSLEINFSKGITIFCGDTGKSSILHAILYALCLHNPKQPIRIGNRSCKVELHLTINGRDFTISRKSENILNEKLKFQNMNCIQNFLNNLSFLFYLIQNFLNLM